MEDNLISSDCPVNEAANITRALKYIFRASKKKGEPAEKDLRKFYNYIHRAKTGEWLEEDS